MKVTELLLPIYEKDLKKLITEIKSYPSEDAVWKVAPGITNSGGNLTLHLIGNLKHFIGSVLGKIDYARDREAEFSTRDIPNDTLINEIEETISAIQTTFKKLEQADLEINYPIEVFGYPVSVESFLIHLESHLNYHLGQVNYHRRILTV